MKIYDNINKASFDMVFVVREW